MAVLAKCQSIKTSGGRPFIKDLYQAILLFTLPCPPEFYLPKQNEKRALSQLRTLSKVKSSFSVIFERFISSFTKHHAWWKTVHGPVVQMILKESELQCVSLQFLSPGHTMVSLLCVSLDLEKHQALPSHLTHHTLPGKQFNNI